MQNANQMCILCNEAITNPICLDCLYNAMEEWAFMTKPQIIEELKNRVWIFKSYTHKVTNCVICKNDINICAHCFCKDIYKWLQEDHPETAESFLISFNYELRSTCKF